MKKLIRIVLVTFLLWTVVCGLWTVYAAVPHLLNYQGRLTDSSGSPLNGSYELTFRIYDAETAGNLLWQETHTGAVIQKGLFGVLLGSVTSLDLAFDKPYFLEIKVGEEVMSPRQQIASTGYAIRAETVEQAKVKADSADSTAGYLSEKVDGITIFANPAISKLTLHDFGNGSDGDIVITANTDISGSFKQYNNLTINPGVTLTAKSCFILVKGTLMIHEGARISADEGGALGGRGGRTSNAGVLTAAGQDGRDVFGSIGGSGGAGNSTGPNVYGENNGGKGGSTYAEGGVPIGAGWPGGNGSSVPAGTRNMVKKFPHLIVFGAGAGGGGAPLETYKGRDGGRGGGWLYIACSTLSFSGSITAKGQVGLAAGSDYSYYGSGGGGGGTVFLVYKDKTGAGTIDVSGGAGGGSGGQQGGSGGAGSAIELDL